MIYSKYTWGRVNLIKYPLFSDLVISILRNSILNRVLSFLVDKYILTIATFFNFVINSLTPIL